MVSSDINWKKLEDEVDRYIRRECPVGFKGTEECKYQQRIAEIRSKYYSFRIAECLSVFAFLVALSIYYFKNYLGIIIPTLIGILIIAIIYIDGRFTRCQVIIQDAERRIQYDSIKSKPLQETTNTPPQAQENIPSRSGNIGQIEYIKAGLDLLKLVISAAIGAMFLLGVYNIQSSSSNLLSVMIGIAIVGVFIFSLCKRYIKLRNELRDLP